MSDLDFKFVVHHGEMVKQKMGGREELAGRDVILVHRLLKNTVSDKVGDRAYAVYSDACIQTIGIDPMAQGLVEHHESIDIIGDVKLWLRDLEQTWTKEDERTHVEVTRADAYVIWEFDVPALRQTRMGTFHSAGPTAEMVARGRDHRDFKQEAPRSWH